MISWLLLSLLRRRLPEVTAAEAEARGLPTDELRPCLGLLFLRVVRGVLSLVMLGV